MSGPTESPDRIDEKTFALFQSGDQVAMSRVVEVYCRPIIGFIRLITRSQEIAEEIAQETFLITYQHRERIINPQSLRAWLFTIARREAIREMKRKSHQAEIGLDDVAISEIAGSLPATQMGGLELADLDQALREPLEKLPKRDRELIILRYFCNLQIKEIAEVLEMPMGSVGVYIQRALEKLRKQFKIMGIKPEDLM